MDGDQLRQEAGFAYVLALIDVIQVPLVLLWKLFVVAERPSAGLEAYYKKCAKDAQEKKKKEEDEEALGHGVNKGKTRGKEPSIRAQKTFTSTGKTGPSGTSFKMSVQ